jgi:hypothetical protein
MVSGEIRRKREEAIDSAQALLMPVEPPTAGQGTAIGPMEIVTATGHRLLVSTNKDTLVLARIADTLAT